jgi:hypothetical protein
MRLEPKNSRLAELPASPPPCEKSGTRDDGSEGRWPETVLLQSFGFAWGRAPARRYIRRQMRSLSLPKPCQSFRIFDAIFVDRIFERGRSLAAAQRVSARCQPATPASSAR